MKETFKGWLRRNLPAVADLVSSVKNRLYFHRAFSAYQRSLQTILYPGRAPVCVLTGPFAGMRYISSTVWGSIGPKWLGSYECELHDVITTIQEKHYRLIVDVGCAEGYYVVGLAVTCPHVQVAAFDTDFISRAQARRLARLNHVAGRVVIQGRCDHGTLDKLLDNHSLLICDIEGFEVHLLDPAACPGLLLADILVEVHESSADDVSVERTLTDRLESTHSIRRILASDRREWIRKYGAAVAQSIPKSVIEGAVEENRASGRVWLWMQPLAARDSALPPAHVSSGNFAATPASDEQ